MGDEEQPTRPPRKAKLDDEFLQHPHTGAFIRNPLRQKAGAPIILSASEYDHNCLDEAMSDWKCITVRESSLTDLTNCLSRDATSSPATMNHLRTTRASLSRLRDLSTGYEFVVTLKKSTYVPPRREKRRGKDAQQVGTNIEKVAIEVTEAEGSKLQVEGISDGLMKAWNTANQIFAVKPGDVILNVNGKHGCSAMLEEFAAAPDLLKISVHRKPSDQPKETTLKPEDVPPDAEVTAAAPFGTPNPKPGSRRSRPVIAEPTDKAA